jgi:hypothetical protein
MGQNGLQRVVQPIGLDVNQQQSGSLTGIKFGHGTAVADGFAGLLAGTDHDGDFVLQSSPTCSIHF